MNVLYNEKLMTYKELKGNKVLLTAGAIRAELIREAVFGSEETNWTDTLKELILDEIADLDYFDSQPYPPESDYTKSFTGFIALLMAKLSKEGLHSFSRVEMYLYHQLESNLLNRPVESRTVAYLALNGYLTGDIESRLQTYFQYLQYNYKTVFESKDSFSILDKEALLVSEGHIQKRIEEVQGNLDIKQEAICSLREQIYGLSFYFYNEGEFDKAHKYLIESLKIPNEKEQLVNLLQFFDKECLIPHLT